MANNKMKKILPIIGLCSILYFSGINSSPALTKDDYIQVKNGKGRVYTVSENEGNNQIHQVAKTAEKEDIWVYTAGKWHDVGKSEEENSALTSLEDIVKLLKKNYAHEEKAKFVHIHPKKIIKERVSPSSVYDFELHGKLKKMFRDKLTMKLMSEVYDGNGVWTYDISDGLEKDILNAGNNGFSKWEVTRGSILVEELFTLRDESLSRKEKIEKYISAVRKHGVVISYKPLEK
ncbi:MAG: hypothetical protein Q8O03_07015 [Nanoarchaeota archaeon]|nr:hypothetical protein [Nanoarchaeota archaeon]